MLVYICFAIQVISTVYALISLIGSGRRLKKLQKKLKDIEDRRS